MPPRSALDPVSMEADRIGFFGKLPSHGDFVSTGLRRSVQDALDAWLQAGIAKAHHHAGENWEQIFRNMPAWRFVAERGVWGPVTVAGVIVPSRDRVGRSFPLVITAQLHEFADDTRKLCLDETWFLALEALAETVSRRDFELDTFTASLKRLRHLRPSDQHFEQRAGRSQRPDTLWWRLDPVDRQNKGFRSGGAPQPTDFLELLMAGMEASGPSQAEPLAEPMGEPAVASVQPQPPAAANVNRIEPEPSPQPVAEHRNFRLRHDKASHVGTRLSLNADAVLAQHTPFLFAVADGVGDGNEAVEASRQTIAMLADTAPQDTIESLVQEMKGKLGRANGVLQSTGGSWGRKSPSASLVSLGIVEDRFALIWAGDARAYLLRDGMMRCLTRDHVSVGLRRSLARAIGLAAQLSPEVLQDELQAGDRFLLCSHSLSRVIPERGIAEILLSGDIDDIANTLIQEGLIADCRENLSAVVIDVKDGNGR
ncbi:type VI secretion system-associated protein TagF [Rhizobiales bacterium RZME27]|uniref:Type VI secretion system-associated protein TagF n=1 Tax=Endobacterium cereale TaxID=2663029 RepID=A0A6A8ABE4_9HYPH|nr:type VI secretion system-associated protein TagF [Endobacterium cereale]MEB2844182.1 type VI secretion system-associated protein TagF [Endobacterium cereale]MQY48595.1 type VI secretion system-associated protein TagF [Endobacterium cereale]